MKNKKIYLLLFVTLFFMVSGFDKLYAQWTPTVFNVSDTGSYDNYDIKFVNENNGYIIGNQTYYYYPYIYRGKIFKTNNGGSNWTQKYSILFKRLYNIEVTNSNTAYVSGDSGLILKTTNDGNTWTALSTPFVINGGYIWYMSFIDANTGWISTNVTSSNPRLYKTTNGGQSWNTLQNSGYLIKFLNDTIGFVVDRNGLFKTTNGGTNWTLSNNDSLISSLYFIDQNTGWCFSRRSDYYYYSIKANGWKTTNGGSTWNTLFTNDSTVRLFNVMFFNSLTGYANNYISPTFFGKTTDGGVNWFNPFNLRYYLGDINFLNLNTGWAYSYVFNAGDSNYIYKTTTGPGNYVNPHFAKLGPISQNSNNINNSMQYDIVTQDSYYDKGLEWPKGSDKHLIFFAGINIGAKVNGQLRVAYSNSNTYIPSDWKTGYIDNSGNPKGLEMCEYGFYQIKTGDGPGVPDWDNWPINQSAPSNNGQPLLLGNQTTFISLTDGYGGSGFTQPLKTEIKWTTYSINDSVPKNDVLFMIFDIINRSGQIWDSTFITFLCDADVGEANDDRMGSDSALNLSYMYNGTNNDSIYGLNPPAVGIKMLQSPISNRVRSSVYFINGGGNYSDPYDAITLWNYMRALNSTGDPYVYNSQVKRFTYDGDPESGTGWVQTDMHDMRLTQTAGPITLNHNDTTRIVIAIIAARGTSNTNSVTKLKQISQQIPIGISNINNKLPQRYYLYQYYP
ncbi:MAG: hypothetical protein H8D45_03725, partial [Bacteroidetes bacterium]|nr:hypothetical protein [Bacteroidota bacterium]